MKSSVLYRSSYAFKNAKTALQHIMEDNNMYECEEEQAKQAEEWNLSEAEDCSNSVIPRGIDNITEDNTEYVPKGKRKVRVSDPVSMKKFMFDKYRLQMYTFLNKCRRNGTIVKSQLERVHIKRASKIIANMMTDRKMESSLS